MKRIFFVFFLLASIALAFAEGTRQWRETGYDEFERGAARGVAIRSTGQLELAPAFKLLNTTPSTFIWQIAADRDGTVYSATGAPARVYRVTPDGKSSVIFEPKELQVQTLALGRDGAIYAGTSPDGKVYKIARKTATQPGQAAGSDYTATVFFDPGTKYIWDLAFDAQGQLYVATGDTGTIFRVDPTGKGTVFFKSDEAHIRVLAFDPRGNLIAGSDGGALVYRITPSGEGFVLYAAPRKEVTALAVDAAGNIFAAATGEKRSGQQNVAPPAPINQPAQPVTAPFVGNVNLGGSDIFQILPDGSPRKLWSSRDDVVYAMEFDANGRLIAGTGNKGRLYAIDRNGVFTDLVKASASQVTSFSKAPNGGLYCSSSNLGKIFLLSNALEPEGTFESDVQDAKIFSRWGRAEVRGRGNFDLFARTGNVDNPDRNWSPWTRIDLNKDSRLEVPPARFVQWRAVLKPGNPSTEVDEVAINYLPKNVSPVVEDITIQQGARFQPVTHSTGPETITVNLGLQPQPIIGHADTVPTANRERGYIAVRWAAHDDNDDNLVYSVFYRGENEREWKLLKSGLQDKFYSFDSGLVPDGAYFIKVAATDAPSHTPEEALTDERISGRFEVDNTAPRIENLAARLEGQGLHVTFHATDDFSPIRRAEFSVDAGDWQYVEPVGQLSDSKTENYDFTTLLSNAPQPQDVTPDQKRAKGKQAAAPVPVSSEHVVVVRVYDRYDNIATAKYVVR
jgi:outer membrane protein assembly factor BamB